MNLQLRLIIGALTLMIVTGGAILIPDMEIASRAAAELPGQDALILLYCRSGRRSALAAKDLVAMGYGNVYDFGGIIDWPYDTVSQVEERPKCDIS